MSSSYPSLNAALVGRYTIEKELGAGGMATVYLAHDVRHDRRVALKVLRPELSAILGAERFLAEIKTTANLQHPHILSLFDSGEADGTVFYVMPYVEGESLRDRIKREQQLPIDDAVRIAREVLDALQYAHDHGIVHRDIKPENILLHGGHAMVADFGIALAASKVEGGTRMTETGMSLGTPHYMSPEQAMGERVITGKADVYALGAVLYEMLTGEPPFTGQSAQAVFARVLTDEPRSITLQRKTVPLHVADAVGTALQKLPADRFGSARDFADALGRQDFIAPVTRARTAAQPAVSASATRYAPWVVAVAALTFAVVATIRRTGTGDARVTAAVIPLELRTPTDLPLNETGPSISLAPDGSFLVYVGPDPDRPGTTALWKRPLDRLDATPIAGTRGAQRPRVMPGGRSVQFFKRGPQGTGNQRWEVDLAGGLPVEAPTSRGLLRLSNGREVVLVDTTVRLGPSGGLNILSAAEAARRPAVHQPEQLRTGWSISPDERWIARRSRTGQADSIIVRTLAAAGADGQRTVIAAGTSPTFIDQDLLVFRAPDSTLRVGRLRADRTGFESQPVAMVPNVSLSGDGAAMYSIADDGTLVYTSGASAGQSQPVWVTPGRETPVAGALPRVYGGVRISPNGRRAALTVGALTSAGDIWIADLAQGVSSPLTSDGISTRAAWTPDGKTVTYLHIGLALGVDTAMPPVIFSRVPDAAAPADSMVGPWRRRAVDELEWSPDGRYLALRMRSGTVASMTRDIVVWRVGTDSLFTLASEPAQERGPRISPDGRWIVYVSNRSSRDEIYAESFPRGGNRVQISLDGGREPVWSRDGTQVFYRGLESDPWMLSARVAVSGGALSVTRRERLFDASPYLANQFLQMYDVAPDGRFLMFKLDAQTPRTDVVIIRNWVQQVKARLAEGAR